MSEVPPGNNIENPEIWKIKGNDYFNKGDFESAIKCYMHAIEQNPNYIEAWNNLGLSLLKIGKIDEAKQVNSKIKQLNIEQQHGIEYQQTSTFLPTSQEKDADYQGYQEETEGSPPVTIFEDLYYAGIWDREFAYLIDSLILVLICGSVVILGGDLYIFTFPAVVVICWFYFAIFEACEMQATLGKKALKIFVTTDDFKRLTYKRSIARSLLKILLTITPLSLLTLINGIAASASAQRKGLHDHIAGTLVLTKKITDKKIDGSINPSKSLSGWYILLIIIIVGIFLILIAAVIAAFIFGLAGTSTQSEENKLNSYQLTEPLSSCSYPNTICNGDCYSPCSQGYYLGSDCTCYPEGTYRCGDVACSIDASCCNGKCYTKCPPGYFQAMDCACYEEGGTIWEPAK